jgi:drug/metabolite transporter (DMT)-like permease
MAAAWMLLAGLLFTLMGVCAKEASIHFSASELVLYRGLVSALFMGLLARHQGVSLKTRHVGMHAWRSFVGVVSLAAWFYAIVHLPLATATTLNYMSSVWVGAIVVGGTMLLRPSTAWQKQVPLLLAVLAGFTGALMVLRPTIEANQAFAGLIGLLSGFVAAFAYLQVKSLAEVGEPEERTVFWFSVGTVVGGLLAVSVSGLSAWAGWHSLWLLPIGLLASMGQLCMTRAYSKGATLLVANLQYSGIIYAALFGWLWFGEDIPLLGWVGMIVIVASGVLSSVLSHRLFKP